MQERRNVLGFGNIELLLVVIASRGDLYSRTALEWNGNTLFRDASAPLNALIRPSKTIEIGQG
jgi:hypothetical protein